MSSTIIHEPSVELQERAHTAAEIGTDDHEITYQHLEPTDGGSSAWKVLVAAFVVEALLWGFPVCYGVFQEYYSSLVEFEGQNTALVGTVAQGVCYLGAPFSAALTKRFARYQRIFIWVGWCLCIIALGCGSITSQLGTLFATQGLLYGLGFTTLYWPIMSMVNEWWVARKGFAFGVVMSAAGAAGAVLPFIFQALLQRYGYKITLRATAVAMLVLTGPLIPFCKGRLPASEQTDLSSMDRSVVRKPLFWVYMGSTLIQGLGVFFPAIFLPSYAADVGLKHAIGALLLSIMAVAQFCGQFAFGFLSDRKFSPSILGTGCLVISSLAAFLLWGFGTSLPLLLVFSILYGFFAYGFATLRSAMAKKLTSDPTTLIALVSILIFGQGVGNMLVGPISAGLIHGDARKGNYGAGKYEDIVYFTGTCMLGSALVLGLSYARWRGSSPSSL